MKMSEAMKMIKAAERLSLKKKNQPKGFMVGFEKMDGCMFHSNYFPDKHAGEKLIKTENEAWKLAERFSKAMGERYVNIYVKDHDFRPVAGYEKRMINKWTAPVEDRRRR